MFENLATEYGLSMDDKSDILRINIEDLGGRHERMGSRAIKSSPMEYKLTDSNKPEAFKLFNTGYIYSMPDNARELYNNIKTTLSTVYHTVNKDRILHKEINKVKEEFKNEKFIAVIDEVVSDDIIFYFGITSALKQLRIPYEEIYNSKYIITKQDANSAGLNITPIETINLSVKDVIGRSGRDKEAFEIFRLYETRVNNNMFRIKLDIDIQGSKLVSTLKNKFAYDALNISVPVENKRKDDKELLEWLERIQDKEDRKIFEYRYDRLKDQLDTSKDCYIEMDNKNKELVTVIKNRRDMMVESIKRRLERDEKRQKEADEIQKRKER